MNKTEKQNEQWPPRPADGIFGEVLDSLQTAQLLVYDRPGVTPENARRSIRALVKTAGLPVAGRVGNRMLFSKTDVLRWLAGRGETRP